MYLSLIFLPLLGSVVAGFFGRRVGSSGAQLITTACVVIATVLAVLAFYEVGICDIPVDIHLFRWIDSEWLYINWGFHFDALTVAMLLPVLIISSLVHIFSISYMSHDPHIPRFFSYLSLFTFMMLVLVTGNNYLVMFVGWEGVGVCSYLLVNFWFTRMHANTSAMSAFFTNRVGDWILTVGMFSIAWTFGNLDYATVFSLAPYINVDVITIIGICLLIGATAKSAQVGLHVWLPQAMEGPTPVSALIHAATMVTAGVYLLLRSSPLIEYSSTVLLLCLWLGAITTVFSSLVGLFQSDIKKIIAFSTMSQLGMMVIAVGLSSYNLALFHLINHAFYKALLFLGAGSVIHSVADNQDLRKYGGLINYLPLTYSVMLIASLSLAAFPFLSGFYSKDFILESAFGQFTFSGIAVYVISTIGAIFTTLYSVKILYLTFLANASGPRVNYSKAHEGDLFMTLPLVILAVFSIFFGFFTKDIFIGLGSNFLTGDNSIFIHPDHEIVIDTEFAVPTFFKLLPFIFTVSFSILAIVIPEYLPESLINFKFSRFGYNIFGFFNQRFLIEMFYNKYITNLVLNLGGHTTKVMDKGCVELMGPFGLEKALIKLSKGISGLSNGIVTVYALYILVGFLFYLTAATLPTYSLYIVILVILMLLPKFLLVTHTVQLRRREKYNRTTINESVERRGPTKIIHSSLKGRTVLFNKKLLYKIFNKENFLKYLTLKRFVWGIFAILITLGFKLSGLPSFILEFISQSYSEWATWLLSGIMSLFIKLPLRGVVEAFVYIIESCISEPNMMDANGKVGDFKCPPTDFKPNFMMSSNPQNPGITPSSNNPVADGSYNNPVAGGSTNQVVGSSNTPNPGVTSSPNDIYNSLNNDLELTALDVDGASNKLSNRLSKGLGSYNNRANLFDTTSDPDTNFNIREKFAIINALNESPLTTISDCNKVYCYANEVGDAKPVTPRHHNIKPGSLVERFGEPNSMDLFSSVNNSKPNLQQTLSAVAYYRRRF